MSVLRSSLLLAFALTAFPWPAMAQPEPAVTPPTPPAPAPSAGSPVQLFRKLLATNSAGRAAWLATRPPATRDFVEAKLREYEALTAPQRDARLHGLELRWYMRSFMPLSPADRAPRLATLPEADRTLLRQRLGRWDILPPQLKKDVLENENLLRIVVATGASNRMDSLAALPAAQREELLRQHERWNELPADRREQILQRFNEFFELRDAERNRVVAKLTDTERAQMEQTLSRFASLSKEEREQAMQGFKKFAGLSPAEQAAFLRTADRWKSMSERDRELWRKVVASLQSRRPAPTPPLGHVTPPAPALSSSN